MATQKGTGKVNEIITITREQALSYIADGHAVYSVAAGRGIMDALAVPWNDNLTFRAVSDAPGTFKGLTLTPESEGSEMVDALTLGSVACRFYNLKPESKFGRGSQGGAYASALRAYYASILPPVPLLAFRFGFSWFPSGGRTWAEHVKDAPLVWAWHKTEGAAMKGANLVSFRGHAVSIIYERTAEKTLTLGGVVMVPEASVIAND